MTENTEKNYNANFEGLSKTLALTKLQIGAVKLRPEDPFQWASGYKMPLYDDNRLLLGSKEHRMLTTKGFSAIIDAEKIEFDYVLGTNLSGIAPASSLATRYNRPLIIINEGQAFEMQNYFRISVDTCWQHTDVIASTVPWGIHNGVTIANNLGKPFIYVRPQKKDHGKQRQVEGILIPGQSVALLNSYMGEENDYLVNAIDAIKQEGGEVKYIEGRLNLKNCTPLNIKDKKVLVIEDLISYGGSSAKEVIAARNLGAIANDLISIFTYNFDEAKAEFKKLVPECQTHSIIPYEVLLEEAVTSGYLKGNDIELLKKWRANPNNWGAEHGFPRVIVEKK